MSGSSDADAGPLAPAPDAGTDPTAAPWLAPDAGSSDAGPVASPDAGSSDAGPVASPDAGASASPDANATADGGAGPSPDASASTDDGGAAPSPDASASTDDASASSAGSGSSSGAYSYPPAEVAELPYKVLVSAEGADEYELTFFEAAEGGPVLQGIQTNDVVLAGSSVLRVHLDTLVASESSPVFVKVVFRKDGREQTAVRALSLAEPEPSAVNVPASARAGDTIQLCVASWDALAYDRPGTPTRFAESDPGRVSDDWRQRVHWSVGGAELQAQGESVSYTVDPALAGGNVEVVAWIHSPETGAKSQLAVSGDPAVASLTVPANLAPGAETVSIAYELVNPAFAIEGARLELFAAGDEATPVWTRELVADELAHGAHSIDWDGKIEGADAARFPDGYATIELSPYTLRLSIRGSGIDPAADTASKTAPVAVEVASFHVAVSPASATDARNRAVCTRIGPLGGDVPVAVDWNHFFWNGSTVARSDGKGDLAADILAATSGEGTGPIIPLVATVTVRGSAGDERRSSKALGNARVLWHWEDAHAPSAFATSPLAESFVAKAETYEPATTFEPKDSGVFNAHVDFGGKRGARNDEARIFEAVEGEATVDLFPFPSARPDVRTWELFTSFSTRAKGLEGRTAALFRPSPVAGDAYRVRALLETAGTKLDAVPLPEAPLAFDCGTFTVRRRAEIVRVIKKCAAVSYGLPGAKDFFTPAHFDLVDAGAEQATLTQAEYDALFPVALQKTLGMSHDAPAAGHEDSYQALADHALPPGSQWGDPLTGGAPTTWIATVRSYDDFKQELANALGLGTGALQQKLARLDLDTDDKYHVAISYFVGFIGFWMTHDLAVAARAKHPAGITILQFDGTTSLGANGPRLGGQAVYVEKDDGTIGSTSINAERRLTGFLLCDDDATDMAHEIGHCLGLPHAPGEPANAARDATIGTLPDRHDAHDHHCLMSYEEVKPGFCGLCLLRLRGYSADAFDRNGIDAAAIARTRAADGR